MRSISPASGQGNFGNACYCKHLQISRTFYQNRSLSAGTHFASSVHYSIFVCNLMPGYQATDVPHTKKKPSTHILVVVQKSMEKLC